jgi:hypothetical protein
VPADECQQRAGSPCRLQKQGLPFRRRHRIAGQEGERFDIHKIAQQLGGVQFGRNVLAAHRRQYALDRLIPKLGRAALARHDRQPP